MKRMIGLLKRNKLYTYLVIVTLSYVMAAVVHATDNQPVPYTFFSGNVASSGEVNANFNHLVQTSWDLYSGTDNIYYNVSGGNVGIGTTNPTAKLDVVDIDRNDNIAVRRTSGGNRCGYAIGTQGVQDSWWICLPTGGEELRFYNVGAGLSKSVILKKDTGNVGIGTSTPSYKLHVIGDIAYTGGIYDVSDFRLKENITPINNAMEKVSSINGIYFNNMYEPPENREVGVIAQEVEKVLPEVVSEDDEGYKSVDYSKLTPLLIEAIKELKAQNEALKARISTLEAVIQP